MSKQRKVEVEILGGVATITRIPKDVTVVIKDYDTEGCDPKTLNKDGAIVSIYKGKITDK